MLRLKDESLLKSEQFIDGQWSQPNGDHSFDVVDPATEEKWHSVKVSSAQDVDHAIRAAHEAFPSFSVMPARERARLLLKFDSLIRDNLEDIAMLLVHETGKPLAEARGEIEYALTFSWWFAGEAERAAGQTIRSAVNPDVRYFTIVQPIGPVGLLTPWNFPVALFVRKAATALAAGCTIVAKPSPETPLSTLALVELTRRAGYAAGVVNVVLASNASTPAVGTQMCQDRRLKKISFTGSTRVGRILMSQCAADLKKLTLELGGSGASLVFEDADLDKAAQNLFANKFRHAGQTCITSQRTFVHRDVIDRFQALIMQKMRTFKLGQGLEEEVNLGPVETLRGKEKAHEHVQDAVAKGAKVLTCKEVIVPEKGFFVQPTLLVNCTPDMLVHQEESFAPIMALTTFSTEDEAVELANDTSMGLTSYVYTENVSRLWRMYEKLKAGNVGLNTGSTTAAEIPFGGIDQSGFGKEAGIGAGLAEYQIIKSATMAL